MACLVECRIVDGKTLAEIKADGRAKLAAAQREAEKSEREEAERLIRDGFKVMIAALGTKVAIHTMSQIECLAADSEGWVLIPFSKKLVTAAMRGVYPATMVRLLELRDAVTAVVGPLPKSEEPLGPG